MRVAKDVINEEMVSLYESIEKTKVAKESLKGTNPQLEHYRTSCNIHITQLEWKIRGLRFALKAIKQGEVKDLSSISTLELIEELKTRQGIEYGASGLYKDYDLTRKYTNRDRHIEADMVLVVRDVNKI